MRKGEAPDLYLEAIPTGSMRLDLALGIGGLPRGGIIEIAGNASSGKTTLSLHLIAEAQKKGGICAFIDTEHAFPPTYARNLGINDQTLYISQPETAEQALEIAEKLVSSCALDLLIIDSATALAPRAEIQGDMGEYHIGLQAYLITKTLTQLALSAQLANTCVIFTTQLRYYDSPAFGKRASTAGGNALKFQSTMRLELNSKAIITSNQIEVGQRTKVKITKNKIAAPFKKTEFEIYFGEGISKVSDLFVLGKELDLITRRGSFYYYEKIPLGRGQQATKRKLKQNPHLSYELESHIRYLKGLPFRE